MELLATFLQLKNWNIILTISILFSTIDYRGETTKAYYKVNDGNWILTTEIAFY